MKNRIKLLVLLLILSFSIFPNVYSEEEHHNADNKLELNDGKRWLANSETTSSISNMIVLMDGFEAKEDPKAYKELSKKIQSEFDFIIKSCSMTGKAHDQLHNYIIPLISLIEELGSPNLKTCKAGFNNLKKHLGKYEKYFE